MADLSPYLGAISVAGDVTEHTGVLAEGAKAGGYAAWINSVTGEVPRVIPIQGTRRVKIVLTDAQVNTMQQWLDSQIKESLKKKEPPIVSYELAPVFQPWAIKKAMPIGIGLFLAGALVTYLITR